MFYRRASTFALHCKLSNYLSQKANCVNAALSGSESTISIDSDPQFRACVSAFPRLTNGIQTRERNWKIEDDFQLILFGFARNSLHSMNSMAEIQSLMFRTAHSLSACHSRLAWWVAHHLRRRFSGWIISIFDTPSSCWIANAVHRVPETSALELHQDLHHVLS